MIAIIAHAMDSLRWPYPSREGRLIDFRYMHCLGTIKVHFSAREKIMRISQNRPLEKFMRFLFMHLNIACITNIWHDNIYADTIYATTASLA